MQQTTKFVVLFFGRKKKFKPSEKNKFDIKKVELDFDSFVKLLLGENAMEYG